MKGLVRYLYILSLFLLNNVCTGFIVRINEKQLGLHEFVGVNQNAIKIYPPSKTPETEYFDLTIEKRNVLKTINQNRNPYENPVVDLLLATRIKYADHSKYE